MARIWIDAGHGGSDPGAVSKRVTEKSANLTVSLELKKLLNAAGHSVGMTRADDSAVPLSLRPRLANEFKADLFVSVHHNAGGGDGYEVIHSKGSVKGKKLADYIAEEFGKAGQNRRGVYYKEGKHGKDYFAVIRETAMPAVITEFAFVDSKDADIIDSDVELKREALAICQGITKYLGEIK